MWPRESHSIRLTVNKTSLRTFTTFTRSGEVVDGTFIISQALHQCNLTMKKQIIILILVILKLIKKNKIAFDLEKVKLEAKRIFSK